MRRRSRTVPGSTRGILLLGVFINLNFGIDLGPPNVWLLYALRGVPLHDHKTNMKTATCLCNAAALHAKNKTKFRKLKNAIDQNSMAVVVNQIRKLLI